VSGTGVSDRRSKHLAIRHQRARSKSMREAIRVEFRYNV
jgi:hypothetical protein